MKFQRNQPSINIAHLGVEPTTPQDPLKLFQIEHQLLIYSKAKLVLSKVLQSKYNFGARQSYQHNCAIETKSETAACWLNNSIAACALKDVSVYIT